LLHGTGGDENDLLSLGQSLAPDAALLGPRGKVLEGSMPRFFRRFAEGVLDEADIHLRAGELAGFVEAASARYGFDPGGVIAVGYSNGANIAAAVLLLHPGAFAGAVLFRAMPPLEPESPPDLRDVGVFLASGRRDPIVPPVQTERLADLLRLSGAAVSVFWSQGGHELSAEDVDSARNWLSRYTIPLAE
jgi:phospholipase/carboxylesterase